MNLICDELDHVIRFTKSMKWDNMYGNDELHNINNEHE
jgi:hypothetical protein